MSRRKNKKKTGSRSGKDHSAHLNNASANTVATGNHTKIYNYYGATAMSGADSEKEESLASLVIPQEYLDWLSRSCAWMHIDNLYGVNSEINVSLPKVFIPLYAAPPRHGKGKESKAGNGPDMLEKDLPRDIEQLILEEPFLVVEGQAGSGKTTVLRHFCHAVCQGDLAGERRLLPVLMFCKDIEAPEGKTPPYARSFERLLEAHLAAIGCGLNAGVVKAFCRAGRAVILVDGLDEIPAALRDWVVESLHDFRERNGRPKVVLAGRPHGLAGAVTTRFLGGKVSVNALVQEQVETFVRNWCCHVEAPKSLSCRVSADELLAALRAHEHLDEMKDTPLMLTAVCMLWYDGKTLPDQRMDLYDKFLIYLLKKRFGNSEREKRFLMALAYELHLNLKRRDIDANPAVDILKTVYPREAGESDADYDARARREFDRVEAGCGLIQVQPESGRYVFWHLSFQAYLAALHCITSLRERERASLLEGLWENEWFKEFIPIYIGSLCLTRNTLEAHDIVKEQLGRQEAAPFVRWRLAAAGMECVHKDWREPGAMESARQRMLEIMASEADTKSRADAGQILGRLGDPRPDLKDGVRIPSGVYRLSMGEVKIEKDFEIGKYPVTNGWFREFVEAKGYENKEFWTPEGRKWLAHTGVKAPLYWHDRKWNNPSAPVVGVCWYEAAAFLNWLTSTDNEGRMYRLPTESEWEAAAAGMKGEGKYPWRGERKEDYCNSKEAGLRQPSVVGVFPKGNTPEGVIDMAGNVWAWTVSDYHSKNERDDFLFEEDIQTLLEDYRASSGDKKDKLAQLLSKKFEEKTRQLPVLRGGSWYDGIVRLTRADRDRNNPAGRDFYAGVRWARTFRC